MIISRDAYIRAVERGAQKLLEEWFPVHAMEVEWAGTVLSEAGACIWSPCEYDAWMMYLALIRNGADVTILSKEERWIIAKKGANHDRLQKHDKKVDDRGGGIL